MSVGTAPSSVDATASSAFLSPFLENDALSAAPYSSLRCSPVAPLNGAWSRLQSRLEFV